MEAIGGETEEVGPSACSDWDCAVCCELLYKPVVPPCGHPFCFWCAHRSMSYTSVSKCPLCRSELTHLPRVSELLHDLLSKKYPKRYAERAKETLEFEVEQEIESMTTTEASAQADKEADAQARSVLDGSDGMEVDDEDEEEAAGEGAQFKCDNCGGALFHPSILSPCSHCLCGVCSGIYTEDKEAGPNERTAQCAEDLQRCPVCECRLVAPPKVCHILNNFIIKREGSYVERANLRRRRRSSLQGAPATARESTDTPAPSNPIGAGNGTENSDDRQMVCPCCSPPSTGTGTGTGPGVSSQGHSGGGEAGTTGPGSPGGQGSEASDSNLQDRIIRVLKSPCDTVSPENFVHFGVGCDGCGVCPIVGPRYKCMECEERIGFDLCAQCHLRHEGPGRFNQQHKADHKMVLVEPKETLLHSLLKNHPGFTAEYLIDLLNGMES